MPEFDAASFVAQATQSIQSQRFDQALELANKALDLDPANSEAEMLKAISLSYLNRQEEATASFRRSVSLDPTSAKAYYNFAVHLNKVGSKKEAEEMAQETVRLDPTHQGANDLLATLKAENGIGGPSEGGFGPQENQSGYSVTPPTMSAPMPEYGGYKPSGHAVAFVEKMGSNWTIVGWVLAITSVLLTVFFFATSGPALVEFYQKLFSDPKFAEEVQRTGQAPNIGSPVYSVFSYLSLALIAAWMIIDLIDRRGKWWWIAPFIFCCCCGMHGVVTGLYLGIGRNRID